MRNYQRLADTRGSDNGGVHVNSGIPNHAFYLACTHLEAAHAWDKAGPIWYATLRALHPKATLLDAAKTTVMFAEMLFGSAANKAVRTAWEEVGVLSTPEIVHVMPILPLAATPAEPPPPPPPA
jgi:Zn-dependent metalloprotease